MRRRDMSDDGRTDGRTLGRTRLDEAKIPYNVSIAVGYDSLGGNEKYHFFSNL